MQKVKPVILLIDTRFLIFTFAFLLFNSFNKTESNIPGFAFRLIAHSYSFH
jgi:hypothetical protein